MDLTLYPDFYAVCVFKKLICIFVIMETLIVEPQNKKQLNAIKAFLKALNVSFRREDESSANPSPSGDTWFLDPNNIAIVKKGIEEAKTGQGVILDDKLKKDLFG